MTSKNPTTQAQPAPQHEIEMRSFLCSLHLERYEQSLIDLGWDDLQVLLHCTELEVRKLAKDAGLLPGHAAKLWHGLQSRKGHQLQPPPIPPTAPSTYPVHWGQPPKIQTKDLTQLPGGYGYGSSTLKAWIQAKLDADAKPEKTKGDNENKSENKSDAESKSDDSISSTYIGVIVDRSGSMASMGGEVVSGFNQFIADQKKSDGICHATITRFDNKVEILKHGVNLVDIQPADQAMFEPRGSTALFDAIGMTISAVEKKVAELKVDRVMIMILTDGHENASTKYQHQTIMKEIERLKAKDWNFIFVGANQDAIRTGARMGIQAGNCLTWTPSRECSTETWNAMSSNLSRYRSPAKSCGFLAEERLLSVGNASVSRTKSKTKKKNRKKTIFNTTKLFNPSSYTC